MNRNKLLTWVILILLVGNLCATGGVIFYLTGNYKYKTEESDTTLSVEESDTTVSAEESGNTFSTEEQTECITLYIGTNDKDTYTQLISLDEAKAAVNEICARYVDGYTVMEAEGGWVDETGTLTEEQTLVYSFTDVQEEALVSIMDEVLKELNQNAILVETAERNSFYYYGE